ncbi:hypothetical protein DFS34DRAFT_645416 [Phlyctochytrium arcticum]|nr:hypothetical protein DFS34DRAFT_645416 [Phlyctochytrium arcticum]
MLEDLDRDLRRVVYGMLTTDRKVLRETVERYYTEDVTLIHPWLITKGRRELLTLFEMYTSWQEQLTGEIFNVAINEAEQTGIVEFAQNVWPKTLGGCVHFKIRMFAVVKWRDTPEGKLIWYHRDVHLWSSLIQYTPIIGRLYDSTWRRLSYRLFEASYGVLNSLGIMSIVDAIPKLAEAGLNLFDYVIDRNTTKYSLMEIAELANTAITKAEDTAEGAVDQLLPATK